MPNKLRLPLLLGALVAIIALTLTLGLAVEPRNKDVWDEEGTGGLCECVFGGSNCSMSGGEEYWGMTITWGTQCENQDFAHGWINCPDGTQLTCNGDYSAQADQSGITCHETGGYSYSRHCTL